MSGVGDRAALFRLLEPLVREAGRVVMEVYATDFAVASKGYNDPVTLADRRANALICDALERAYPGVPIVAEESDRARYAGFEREQAAFFVDPLDGTREFVARNGEFVVMVGLAEHGRAVAGVVHAPVSGLLWRGAVGEGAFEIDEAGAQRPLAVSSAPSLQEARVVVSRSRRSEQLERLLRECPPREIHPLGSAGLKGTAIARAEADLYVQLGSAGSLWDTCGPEAIVLAAGGRFTDQHGAPLSYLTPDVHVAGGVVAANPALHRAIVDALNG